MTSRKEHSPRPHIGQHVRRQGETGRTPTWKRRETLSLGGARRAFLPHPCQDDPRKMPEAVVAKARGRTGMESDSDLLQTALANLTLPDYFPDWLFSQNSMADAQCDGFPLPSATRSVRTDSVLRGIRVGFLKPIEHLILDDSISEVMVNGGDRVFIEKAGYLNILGRFIPEDERILLIEDTAEIQLSHANLVRFEARRPDNGVPGIPMRDLLKATLRHRQERILLGEIRGGEALELFYLLKNRPAGKHSSISPKLGEKSPGPLTSLRVASGVDESQP